MDFAQWERGKTLGPYCSSRHGTAVPCLVLFTKPTPLSLESRLHAIKHLQPGFLLLFDDGFWPGHFDEDRSGVFRLNDHSQHPVVVHLHVVILLFLAILKVIIYNKVQLLMVAAIVKMHLV